MFTGAIRDLGTGNDDVVFLAFLWHVILKYFIYFKVVSNCNYETIWY